MLAIRLMPVGKKGQRTFRIVVSDKKKDLAGDYLEMVGTMDAKTNPRTITLKEDRIKHWLGNGAQPSGTVHNLLVDAKLIDAKKIAVSSPRKKSKKGDEAAEAEKKSAATPEAADKKEDAPAEPAAPAKDNKKEDAPAPKAPAESNNAPTKEESPS